jgi:hypothetical protein
MAHIVGGDPAVDREYKTADFVNVTEGVKDRGDSSRMYPVEHGDGDPRMSAYAIKTYGKFKKAKQAQIENMNRETTIILGMNHPNLVRLLAYGRETMIIERLPHLVSDGIESIQDMVSIAIGCMRALKYMHLKSSSGCMRHGDVRGPKITYSRDDSDGTISRVVLGDLTTARPCEITEFTGRLGFVPMPSDGEELTGNRYHDVVSLAMTLVISYFGRHFVRPVITYENVGDLIALLPPAVKTQLVEMTGVGRPGVNYSDAEWSTFMDGVITGWVNIKPHAGDLPEVHEIPDPVIVKHVRIPPKGKGKSPLHGHHGKKPVLPRHQSGPNRPAGGPGSGPGSGAGSDGIPDMDELVDIQDIMSVFDPNDTDHPSSKMDESDISRVLDNFSACVSDKDTFRYKRTVADIDCAPVGSGAVRGEFSEETRCCEINDSGAYFKYLRVLEVVTRGIQPRLDTMENMQDVSNAVDWIRSIGKQHDDIVGSTVTVRVPEDGVWYDQLLEFMFKIGLHTVYDESIVIVETGAAQNSQITRVVAGDFHVRQGEADLIGRMQRTSINGSVKLHLSAHGGSLVGLDEVVGPELNIIPCRELHFVESLLGSPLDISLLGEFLRVPDPSPVATFDIFQVVMNAPCYLKTHVDMRSFIISVMRGMRSHDARTQVRVRIGVPSGPSGSSDPNPDGMVPVRPLDGDEIRNVPGYAREALGDSITRSVDADSPIGPRATVKDPVDKMEYLVSYNIQGGFLFMSRAKSLN